MCLYAVRFSYKTQISRVCTVAVYRGTMVRECDRFARLLEPQTKRMSTFFFFFDHLITLNLKLKKIIIEFIIYRGGGCKYLRVVILYKCGYKSESNFTIMTIN